MVVSVSNGVFLSIWGGCCPRRRNWEHPEVVVRSGEWPGWDPGRMAWYGGLWSHWRRLNDGVS